MIRLVAMVTLLPLRKAKPVIFATMYNQRRSLPGASMSIRRKLVVVTGILSVCLCFVAC
jgi:hypothetical protein